MGALPGAGREVVAFYDGSGFAWRVTKNTNGIYTSPAGIDDDLVQNSDGTFTLTDHASGGVLGFGSGGYLSVARNRAGNQIAFTYQNGRLAAVIDTEGQTIAFGYDGYGNMTTVTDPASRVWTYEYLRTGSVTSGTAAESQLTDIIDPDGNTIAFNYDAAGNLTQIANPNGNLTAIGHDAAGRVSQIVAVTNAGTMTGPTTTFSYGVPEPPQSATQQIAVQCPVAGTCPSGYPCSTVTDPNTHTSTYCFDPSGRTTSVTAPDGTTARTSWTGDNHVAQVTLPSGASTTYSYDNLNNLTRVTAENGLTRSCNFNDGSHPYLPSDCADPQGNSTSYPENVPLYAASSMVTL